MFMAAHFVTAAADHGPIAIQAAVLLCLMILKIRRGARGASHISAAVRQFLQASFPGQMVIRWLIRQDYKIESEIYSYFLILLSYSNAAEKFTMLNPVKLPTRIHTDWHDYRYW